MKIFSTATRTTQIKPPSSIFNAMSSSHQPIETFSQTKESQNPNQTEYTREELSKIVSKINTYIQALDTRIAFRFNEEMGVLGVDVVEIKSGQLIRKVPCDEVVRLAEYYQRIYGIIFDKTT